MYANHVADRSGIGIDLADDSVTANDMDDAETGAKQRQNLPVLDNALITASGLSVTDSLDVPADAVDERSRIALYESAGCDASGHGEGDIHLGSEPVTAPMHRADRSSSPSSWRLPRSPWIG